MKIDLTGLTFNRLTVMWPSAVGKYYKVYWACVCSCGCVCHIVGHSITSGHTTSCGCAKREAAKILGVSNYIHGPLSNAELARLSMFRRKNNIDKFRAKEQAWRESNRDKVCKNNKKCYEAHRKDYISISKAWQQANPEKVNAKNHARRARLRLGGKWTVEDWNSLKEFYDNRCLCCGRHEMDLKVLGMHLVPDHVVPVVKGGSNTIYNLQPLCHSRKRGAYGGCNNRKYNKTIDYRPQSLPI